MKAAVALGFAALMLWLFIATLRTYKQLRPGAALHAQMLEQSPKTLKVVRYTTPLTLLLIFLIMINSIVMGVGELLK